jgi:hypothetical protein
MFIKSRKCNSVQSTAGAHALYISEEVDRLIYADNARHSEPCHDSLVYGDVEIKRDKKFIDTLRVQQLATWWQEPSKAGSRNTP